MRNDSNFRWTLIFLAAPLGAVIGFYVAALLATRALVAVGLEYSHGQLGHFMFAAITRSAIGAVGLPVLVARLTRTAA